MSSWKIVDTTNNQFYTISSVIRDIHEISNSINSKRNIYENITDIISIEGNNFIHDLNRPDNTVKDEKLKNKNK